MDDATIVESRLSCRDKETSVRFDRDAAQGQGQGQSQGQGQGQGQGEGDEEEEHSGETEGGRVSFSRNFMLKKGHGMERISFKVVTPLDGASNIYPHEYFRTDFLH